MRDLLVPAILRGMEPWVLIASIVGLLLSLFPFLWKAIVGLRQRQGTSLHIVTDSSFDVQFKKLDLKELTKLTSLIKQLDRDETLTSKSMREELDRDETLTSRSMRELEQQLNKTVEQLRSLPTMPGEPTPANPIRRVQEALRREDYYEGPVDGSFGPQTLDAIKRFQRDLGAKTTGSLTVRQADFLVKRLAVAQARKLH